MTLVVRIIRERKLISDNKYIESWEISYGFDYWYQGEQKIMSIEKIIKLLQNLGTVDLHIRFNPSHTYDFLIGNAQELQDFFSSVNINLLEFQGYFLPNGDWSYLNSKNIKHVESEVGSLSGLKNLNHPISLVNVRKVYK